MNQFAAKYETLYGTRPLTTPWGKATEVSGGTYGWAINEAAEADALIASIKAGEQATKEPVYEQRAASHEQQGFQVGANDFISKPFNKEELIIRVTHQISLVAAKRLILSKTEELQRTIAGRDKLYSVIAHDLRSPMGSIKMVLNMLILNLPSEKIGAEMYELLTMANQTTEDVFSLLDNLLKWTKSQIGKLNVVYQDVDLVEVTDGVIEIFSMVASLKKIRIREMKPEKMMVNADIDMLKTVVRNLLSNAIKFSKENSEVLVKMEEVDGMAVVSVQDYGCGISEEGQKKLLHTDTHFSTFGTNNEEGSGLGLLLCKDFVVKNGGKLWFTSKEGEGSIFSFSIPVKK